MSEFDTSTAARAWQDPAIALQIAGMLAPNVTHTRNTLYGPQRTTIGIRNALSGFGQMYGGLQQRRENEDLMTWLARRAASQQQMSQGREVMPTEPNASWAMGEAQGAPTLPGRAVLPLSLSQQAAELAKPTETSAQAILAMSPKQRETYMRGAVGATPSPMMAQFEKQRAETDIMRQQQRDQLMLQAVEKLAADPSDTESAGVVSSLLGAVRPETAAYAGKVFQDNRFLTAAASLAKGYGLPFVRDPAYMREVMGAVSVAAVRRDSVSKANNDALDTFEKQWAATYPQASIRDILGPLRVLANTGEPLHPSVVANAGNAAAMAQFSSEFPEYGKAKAAGQPLGEDLIRRMQASNFWGIASRDVDEFQVRMLDFKMRRDEYNERNKDRDAALAARREGLDWRRGESLGQALHVARQEYVEVQSPAFITSQLGWLKQPNVQGQGGEVTPEYRAKFLEPAIRKYNDLNTRFEAASDYFGMTHTPAVMAQEHVKEAARTIAEINKTAKTPEERAVRFSEFRKRIEAKEYFKNVKVYQYGPVVLDKILTMIGEAERSVPSVAPPGVGTAKPAGSTLTEEQLAVARERQRRWGLYGPPREPEIVTPKRESLPLSSEQRSTIIAEIIESIPAYRGMALEQLRPDQRRHVLGKVLEEIRRRQEVVDAEIARRSASSFSPPVGATGP